MPNDKTQQREQIKVTDKRIFTADGQIREEFRDQVRPAAVPAPQPLKPADVPKETKAPEKVDQAAATKAQPRPLDPPSSERRRTITDQAPDTPFTHFLEQLIAQAYMFLGLLRTPHQVQPKVDAPAARQMIEILTLLSEKTKGNLTPDEQDFFSAHLGELKLAYVQRTKKI